MLDPATVLDRARRGSVPEDWQVFQAARRPFLVDLVACLLGTASAAGFGIVAGGPGDSEAVALWFTFFALLGALSALGVWYGLRHVDQFLLVLTTDGMVERHFLRPGSDTRVVPFAAVQAMQLTRKRPPMLIVSWRDGRTERIPLLTLRMFGPPAEVGGRIANAYARYSAPEESEHETM